MRNGGAFHLRTVTVEGADQAFLNFLLCDKLVTADYASLQDANVGIYFLTNVPG